MTVLLLVSIIAVVILAAVAVGVYVRTRAASTVSGNLYAPPVSDAASRTKDASPEEAPALDNLDTATTVSSPEKEPTSEGEDSAYVRTVEPKSLWKARLAKARGALGAALGTVLGRQSLDSEAWDALEEALLGADVGVKMTMDLVASVESKIRQNKASRPEDLVRLVKAEILEVLEGKDRSLATADTMPTVYLFAGVNGTGKTTSIAKLAKRLSDAGESVVVAAADTFRAAATEQLEVWADRVGAHLVKASEGADPGAVVFDSIGYARAHGASYLLIDTAGRLHTNRNLMEELAKIVRVAAKAGAPPTEILLVIDATTGQNGLAQAAKFKEAVNITGIVLTKLDGSAKGGIVVAIEDQLGVPVKLVGIGETADDLVFFDPREFTDALFEESMHQA